jgi:oligopeptide/dipeptide ABC transporter ATP-binding protein
VAPLLQIEDLTVRFDGPEGPVRAVDGLSLSVERGETYALVGESGSGKSTVGFAAMRLTEPGIIEGGRILLDGRDLMTLGEKEMCGVRGARIGLVFQEPATALNPVMRIGAQVGEAIRIHKSLSRQEVREEVVRLLRMVSLPEPDRVARAYAHELSGGMAQRVMLAIALSCGPDLLIADEPTSALDVTIQSQVLALLRRLKRELGLTLLFITHDFGVVAENADRVGVMYAGRLVEEAPLRDLFADPKHPYTRGLMASQLGADDAPREGKRPRLATIPGAAAVAAAPPPGCRFHPRCAERFEPCDRIEPVETRPSPGRKVWCFLHDPQVRGKA